MSLSPTHAEPFRSPIMAIEPEWIDHNGHLNLAYYHVLFDRGIDAFFETLGLGPSYLQACGLSTFSAETHVCYIREVKPGAQVFATTRIIDHDEKRMHLYQELFHHDGWLAATLESLSLSVDLSGPRVVPFPSDIAARIAARAARDTKLARPERLGRSIGLRRRSE